MNPTQLTRKCFCYVLVCMRYDYIYGNDVYGRIQQHSTITWDEREIEREGERENPHPHPYDDIARASPK